MPASDIFPQWDLSPLKPEGGDLHKALTILQPEIDRLQHFETQIAQQSPAQLAQIITAYQDICETLAQYMTHADLTFASNMEEQAHSQYAQDMREALSARSSALLFIELELALMPEPLYQQALKHPDFHQFQPWLRLLRQAAPYQLEPRLEKMLVEHSVSGRSAWVRLFDESMSALRFPFQGQMLTEAEILTRLTDKDPAHRREAGHSLAKILDENQRLFALILNIIAKDKEIDDRWRGFERPVSSRNLANDVDDRTVDALNQAVNTRMATSAHRYYRLKAGWMGSDHLHWWDRNAPLPGDDDRRFSWEEAKSLVLEAFSGFDPRMAEMAARFFDEGWIDAGMRAGKTSGAFSHPAVPSVHPYILLNFDGRARDVMTLAHEMGHGIHQMLAGRQGYFMADTPLTLAETASVFAEMLVFRKLLATSAKGARRFLLAAKIEDMMNTVIRQIAFHNFETAFHDARKQGELSVAAISTLWLDTQKAALGEAVILDERYRSMWAYIPHFVHTPFYVYAYAFGDCLVNALWQNYQSLPETGRAEFVGHYHSLLQAGGTVRYDSALKPFGLDATKSEFWHCGLDMLEGMIDALEEVAE